MNHESTSHGERGRWTDKPEAFDFESNKLKCRSRQTKNPAEGAGVEGAVWLEDRTSELQEQN